MYEYKGTNPTRNGMGRVSEKMEKDLDSRRPMSFRRTAMAALQKRYLDESQGTPVHNVWDDISPINSQAAERLGYPTQKPVALLERIIRPVVTPATWCWTRSVGAAQPSRRRRS